MKIVYNGPGGHVEVRGFGRHIKGLAKEYPDEAGRELLATSKRQQFSSAESDLSELIAAAKMAVDDGKVLSSGKPDAKAMSEIMGREVTAKERDLAWAELNKPVGKPAGGGE